jgi:peptide/nickel transport system substrate-binding protein
MQKAGAPAYQLAATSEEGYNADIAPVPYDPAGAKKLLAEAGYPDGFKLTIFGPAGFIANDDKILPAIGGFLSRIGIDTAVQSISPAVYFGKATAREYSVFMTSYQATTAINGLKALMVTKSAETGDGPFNRHLYSNKAVDDLVFQAQATNDPVARNKLVGQAMKTAMDDGAVIPIATSVITYAARKEAVKYNAVPIGWAWAMLADPA